MIFPVSIKGVVLQAGRVLLLRNDRDEWELPGGRLEIGETPEEWLAREIAEETGWQGTVGPILDCWIYHITQVDRHVVVVTYGVTPDPAQLGLAPVISAEHRQVGLFSRGEGDDLPMPLGYRRSIADWYGRAGS